MKTGKPAYAMSAKNDTLVLDIFNKHQCFAIRILCETRASAVQTYSNIKRWVFKH